MKLLKKPETLIGTSALIAVAFVAFLILKPFSIVSPGERGVKVSFGKVTTEPYGEGLHWIVPVRDTMRIVDIKTQKFETPTEAASSDMQKVRTDITVNYNVIPKKAVELVQRVGSDYEIVVVRPAVQEALKAAVAKFEAEELIQKREEVSDLVFEYLNRTLNKTHIQVSEISIEDFKFSDEFNAAIEAKVTAEQSALREKNILEEIKYKAQQEEAKAEGAKQAKILSAEANNQQRILEAKAQAEAITLSANAEAQAIKVKAQALAKNPQILNLIQLEIEQTKASKWTGALPTNVYGSAPIPFINIETK